MGKLNIRTLVDCGCETTVWGDHSGVEIEYCDEHAAAPDLLAACESLIAQYDAPGGPTITDQVNAMRAAIAKAKGVRP